jgi:hypothetical protein
LPPRCWRRQSRCPQAYRPQQRCCPPGYLHTSAAAQSGSDCTPALAVLVHPEAPLAPETLYPLEFPEAPLAPETLYPLEFPEVRLARLYDALESGKLDLNDLAPRIKELRAKQDELSKARVVAEAEMTLQGYQQLDIDAVRSYVADLRNLLDKSEVAQRKAFLRSFVKKIVVEKERVKLYYNLPVPPDGRKMDTVGVLPIDTPGGPFGTVPELLFEKKRLIPALQQLLTSY